MEKKYNFDPEYDLSEYDFMGPADVLDSAGKLYLTIIPQPILQACMSLSPVQFKFFIYLCMRANFLTTSPAYGKAWLTHKEISEATGIGKSEMQRYDRKLQEMGLISVSLTTKAEHNKGQAVFKSTHIYSIDHMFNNKIKAKMKAKK